MNNIQYIEGAIWALCTVELNSFDQKGIEDTRPKEILAGSKDWIEIGGCPSDPLYDHVEGFQGKACQRQIRETVITQGVSVVIKEPDLPSGGLALSKASEAFTWWDKLTAYLAKFYRQSSSD